MRKFTLFALAIVLALAAAVPASAQPRRQPPTYDAISVMNRNRAMVNGMFGEMYGHYPYYRHESRGGRFLRIVFGPEPYYPYGTRPYGYDDETPAKCFERVVKTARKQHVAMDATEAMAFCNGQTPESHAPEPPPSVSQASTPRPVSVARNSAFIENGRLCNNDSRPLTVLVDSVVVGTLAPGQYVSVSQLPPGQLSYRY